MNLAYHDAKYADLYEETMYNALMGSIDLEGKHLYYPNPLDANGPRTSWHSCPCCVGNIPRTLLMLPTWLYAKSSDGIYVNMFVGSAITLRDVAGTDVEMVQNTDYPWSGKVAITVNPKQEKSFSVRIRVPVRNVSKLYTGTPAVNGITSLTVNGTAVKAVMDKGYAVVTRAWKTGDKIEAVLPMVVQRVKATDNIEADRGKVALRYGPLIYNIEKVDQDISKGMAKDSPLTTEWRPTFLGGVVVIQGKFADGSPMLAIPNYARTNRDSASPTDTPPQGSGGVRPAPGPVTSIVWMKEG
jgi:hypothetical protein